MLKFGSNMETPEMAVSKTLQIDLKERRFSRETRIFLCELSV